MYSQSYKVTTKIVFDEPKHHQFQALLKQWATPPLQKKKENQK